MSHGSEKSTSFIAIGVVALLAVLGAGALVSQLTAPDEQPPHDARPAVRRPTALASRQRPAAPERAPASRNSATLAARGGAPSQPLRELQANDVIKREAPPARPQRPRAEQPRQVPGEQAAEAQLAEHPAAAAPPPSGGAVGDAITADFSTSNIEHALAEVGVSAQALDHYRGRYDELAERTAQVHHDAAREGWLNTPRFREEMDEIEADRLAVRDEIGDEAYDLLLFATGQTNRVQVNSVDQPQSGAVGALQSGDIIVSYDGVRIFSPAGLAIEMAAGTPGQSVRVDILRQGKPMQIDVPDGVLPIGMEVAQEPPERLR
jgi:hypothetical protein